MDDSEIESISLRPIFIAGALVFILWIANFIIGICFYNVEEAGQRGDMFGAVNALFSGMAFVGVFYAIMIQRNEIKIARLDVKYTKTILDEQKQQMEEQNNSTKKQVFENTFFKMLDILIDTTIKIEIKSNYNATPISIMGKASFLYLLDDLKARVASEVRPFEEYYLEFYNNNNHIIGHYFRFLFNLMNFIENSDIKNQVFYSKLVRAQLSDHEVAVLFYNGLSQKGGKFKPLIEKYGLLKNLNDRDILDPDLKLRYSVSAFGSKSAKV